MRLSTEEVTAMMSAAANVDSRLELIARCLDRDDLAWKQFFEKHDPAIERGVRKALGAAGHDQNLVNDLVQEVRILLVNKPKVLLAYDPAKGSLEGYLAGVAILEVRRYCAKSLRRK